MIQKKKFSDAIAANISVVGELLQGSLVERFSISLAPRESKQVDLKREGLCIVRNGPNNFVVIAIANANTPSFIGRVGSGISVNNDISLSSTKIDISRTQYSNYLHQFTNNSDDNYSNIQIALYTAY